MKKITMFLAPLLCGISLLSCDKKEITGDNPAPSANIKISNVTRTSADITIETDAAADYAYAIVNDSESISFSSAEELFEKGKTAIFESGSVTIHTDELTGGQKYTVYAATRKINPFVYSELTSAKIDADIDYTEAATLEHIGLTDFSYHIEVPELEENVFFKHIVVSKNDYEAIKKIFEGIPGVPTMTEGQYLASFGYKIEASETFTINKTWETAQQDAINIYSGTEYYIITGKTMPGNDMKVDDNTVNVLKFWTKKAEETPYKIEVSIDNITSLAAEISVTPEEGITEYRAFTAEKKEFDAAEFEGMESVRGMIIGNWDDQKNIETGAGQRAYKGAAKLTPKGLKPQSEYIFGVVGFDADGREFFKLFNFTTKEPSGPKPEIILEEVETQSPWSEISVNVKVKNTASIYACLAKKEDFDYLLNQGSSLTDIIKNNGQMLGNDVLTGALSESGAVITSEKLEAETDYSFGICAINEEGIDISERIDIRTTDVPQAGGEIRANMPGEYTATTKNENGETVTFPVTIAKGVNKETEAEYAKANRLVVLGFGNNPDFSYMSPEQIIEKGLASNAEEANQNYGPKWFIEFFPDGTIGTSKEVAWNDMGYFMTVRNGEKFRFSGLRKNSNGYGWVDSLMKFPVSVSEDGNTVTINSATDTFDNIYFPAMMKVTGEYSSEPVIIFTSEIVLVRKASKTAKAGIRLPLSL